MEIKMPDYLKGLPDTANISIREMAEIYGLKQKTIAWKIKNNNDFPKPAFKASQGTYKSQGRVGCFKVKTGKLQWNLGEVRKDVKERLEQINAKEVSRG